MVGSEMRAWPKFITSATIALAYSAEAADVVLLTSMYLGIGRSLKVSLLALGSLAMYRGLVQVRRGDDSFERQCLTHLVLPTYLLLLVRLNNCLSNNTTFSTWLRKGGSFLHERACISCEGALSTLSVYSRTACAGGHDALRRHAGRPSEPQLSSGAGHAPVGLLLRRLRAVARLCAGALQLLSRPPATPCVNCGCVCPGRLREASLPAGAGGTLLVSTGGCCRRAGTLGLHCRALPDRQTGHGCHAYQFSNTDSTSTPGSSWSQW